MKGKRYSRQRELIYQAVTQTDQHPTAEMIYHWLKPENPNLSLGTVYRNLNLLVDEGTIVRMAFPVERYDADTTPHTHFCCDRCGGVYDLKVPYDDVLDEQAALQSGHIIERHELLYRGICSGCRRAGQTTAGSTADRHQID